MYEKIRYTFIKVLKGRLFMRIQLTLTIILFFAFQLGASSFAQRYITINKKDVSMKQLFQEIEKQTDFTVFYAARYVDENISVPAGFNKTTIKDVLERSLKHLPLTYVIKGNTIVLKEQKVESAGSMAKVVAKDQQSITGVVRDQNGKPLAGVTVSVIGASNTTVSQGDGSFTITADRANVLGFYFVGYKRKTQSVDGRSSLQVVLEEDVSDLDEVVVVGYGTMKKKDLTGSVAQMKTEQLEVVPVYNIEQALKGGASGVRVVQNSGAPGSRVEVRIRGGNSMIGDNQPLYVVDGFPVTGDISYLNPSDIESMDILKDASATAIYGSRGANGVVIITSKKGKAGQTRIDAQSQFGLQQDIKRLKVLGARDYAIVANEWLKNSGQQELFDLENMDGIDTDWQSEVLRSAGLHNHTLAFSGGGERTRYSVSGNYYDQDGILINSGAKRGTMRLNLENKLYDWLDMNLNLNLARAERFQVPADNGNFGNTVYSGAVSAPPTLPVYGLDGLYTQIGQIYSFAEATMVNPLIFNSPYKDRSLSNVVIGNTSFTFKLAEGLTFKTLVGLENHNISAESFTPLYYENDRGAAAQGTTYRNSFLNENILNYSTTINERHELGLMGGLTYQDETVRSSNISVSGFANNNTQNYNLGVAEIVNPPSSGKSKWALASWLARANYSYDDRYLVTASFRADGSSRFGQNNKWAFFPSGAVAWKINNESFLSDVEAINELKLRASIGVTGNSALSPYQSLNRISGVRAIYGNSTEVVGFVPTGIANPDLKWETTTQMDVGLDFVALNNRLRLTADYYVKNTTDLLASVPLPPSVGFGAMLQNIGEIRNQGFEFDLSGDILTKDFKWDAGIRLSTNKNKIKTLAGGNDVYSSELNQFRSSMNIAREGYPFGMFLGLVEDGLDDNGFIKYVDQNQDGQINALDRVIIGTPYPSLVYGFNSNFSYKNFDLNVFIEGVTGNDIFWATAGTNLNSFQRGTNQFQDLINNYWTAENPNPNAKYPKISSSTLVDVSDRFIEDGSYLRLKSVKLAYNVPIDRLTKSKVKRAQVYLSGVNLFTITDYPGIDPDVNTTGSDNQGVGDRLRMGIDQSAYPTAKMYMVGVNLSF